MDRAVERFEILAPVTNHGPRKSSEGFFRDFDRARREELVV
jgi:hypothetical protein